MRSWITGELKCVYFSVLVYIRTLPEPISPTSVSLPKKSSTGLAKHVPEVRPPLLPQIDPSHRRSDALLQPLNHLLLKLLTLGMFPSTPPSLPSHPSFFSSTLPTIRQRLHLASLSTTSSHAASSQYSETWTASFSALPLTSQQTFLISLLAALDCRVGRNTSTSARGKVGGSASVLRGVLGKPSQTTADDGGLWSALSAVVCGSGRVWDIGVVRAVVCWIADPQDSSVDETGEWSA